MNEEMPTRPVSEEISYNHYPMDCMQDKRKNRTSFQTSEGVKPTTIDQSYDTKFTVT
jgi:hypothetical protein